jgi:AraC-like DNA-binding protein
MWEEDQEFHVEAGQSLHLWPGRQHGSSKSMPPDLRFYWIHFNLDEELGDTNTETPYVPFMRMPQHKTIAEPERIERLFRIFLEDQETGALHTYAANLLTTLMLVEVARSHEASAAESSDLKAIATWANTYIRLNYDRSITAGKIAMELGYNPDYLGRVYRQIYHCTLTEAIQKRRIHVACHYLLNSGMTVEQIAEKCGFSEPDYFRRIFRRQMQTSPGTYRKQYAHVKINTH